MGCQVKIAVLTKVYAPEGVVGELSDGSLAAGDSPLLNFGPWAGFSGEVRPGFWGSAGHSESFVTPGTRWCSGAEADSQVSELVFAHIAWSAFHHPVGAIGLREGDDLAN